MKRRELIDMIEEGENIQVEFKRKFSSYEKIAKEIIAFANTKGGYILFGVDDNKDIIGVESEKEEAALITETAAKYCEPPIEVTIEYMEFRNKEIVIAGIAESDKKPHRLQDFQSELDINSAIVNVRVNDKSIPASKEMIRIMRAQAGNLPLKKYYIGDNEKAVFNFLSKNETITVKQLSQLINISERRASRTLVKMVRAHLLIIHTKDNGEEFFSNMS
ncbi:MAG: ATP-binding protein [Bacteroidota bacterium]|nr:ATP-binding protein [Bacteroidota bacterium]